MTDLSNVPRGIRNNNPGNIDFDEKTKWQGLTGSDGRFCIFDKPENGIRAIARLLSSYKAHGAATPRQIISRWAPNNENNTEAYINSVTKTSGVAADATLLVNDYPKFIAAIILHENGEQPYTISQLTSGVLSAFPVMPK